MPQGNWTCSACGGEITELPFEPRSTENLLCRECHAKKRSQGGGNGGNSSGAGDRKMYQGDWKCADCGGAITELPFQPRETGNLRCRECFKKSRNG